MIPAGDVDSRAVAGCNSGAVSKAVAGCGSRAMSGCIAWIVAGCVAWIVLSVVIFVIWNDFCTRNVVHLSNTALLNNHRSSDIASCIQTW